MLEALDERRGYVLNIAFGDEVRTVEVGNIRAASVDNPASIKTLIGADCCFTAVGERNLELIAPLLRAASRERNTPLPVLCGENGTHVARKLIELVGDGENLRAGDTVMGRMCRWMNEVEIDFAPLCDATGAGIATDDFDIIPYHLADCTLPPEYDRLQPLGERDFALFEHMKFFGHNCLHGLFAFAAARKRFSRMAEAGRSPELVQRAERMLYEELEPSLARHYGETFDAKAYRIYIEGVKDRVLSRGLNDTVERGVRAARDKLRPDERWVQAVRFVRSAGIRPAAYLETIADVILASGLLETMPLEDVLADHCGLDREETSQAYSIVAPLLKPVNKGDLK